MYIFSYVEEKFKNEIKVQKIPKIYHYNYINVKVNFEARSSLVYIFLFFFIFVQIVLYNQN